jgi:hypothetical protein
MFLSPGCPQIINLGAKQSYVYKDVNVTFNDRKVSDVQSGGMRLPRLGWSGPSEPDVARHFARLKSAKT